MPKLTELQSTPALAPGDLVYVVADGVSSKLASLRVANIAAMTAIAVPLNGMSVEVTEDGRGGLFVFDTAVTAAGNGGTTFSADDATTGSWVRRYSGPVDVRWFGAKDDGSIDTTPFLLSALGTGNDVLFTQGDYLFSPSDLNTVPNLGAQKIIGSGGVTWDFVLPSSTRGFYFSGAVSLYNITIDFNNGPARYPFFWHANAGLIELENISVQNLKDTDNTTGTVVFFITPTGNRFSIRNLSASNLLKRGNGSIAATEGSLNVIYVGNGSGSTQGVIENAKFSNIHNINASDVIIYEDTACIYVQTESDDENNAVVINNIEGNEFGKRLLKIHASNVRVSDVTGVSHEGDSLGVLGFLSGEGLGDKYGCSAENCRAVGKMEAAFSGTAYGIRWTNISASVQPGTKAGMSSAAIGLWVNGQDVTLDGFWSDSARDIAVGWAAYIVKNITLNNVHLVLNAAKAAGSTIHNVSDTIGFDGLTINNLFATVESGASTTQPIYLWEYIDGTTKKGRNLSINNVVIQSAGPVGSGGILSRFNENVSIRNVKYLNTSVNAHLRPVHCDSCVNVHIADVHVEGVNSIGVLVQNCTGRNVVGPVCNPDATVSAVYNNGSAEFWAYGCDHSDVSGQTTATPQHTKYTTGATGGRPSTGLVAGFSQHFDTTLGKPIWWNGSVWVDSSGASV